MTGHLVDAGPVREHVRRRLDEGMTQSYIARVAHVSNACISRLLHGSFEPGRPEQETMQADTADRLLAVGYQEPESRRRPATDPLCSGARFEPVGFRAGRCLDCGQVAPVRRLCGPDGDYTGRMISHPPARAAASELPLPAEPVHEDCGFPRGYQRHMRENTPLCDPCRAAKRGYEQGLKGRPPSAPATAVPVVPAELVDAVVKLARAFLLRRPVPQVRGLCAAVVRIHDAEATGTTTRRAPSDASGGR